MSLAPEIIDIACELKPDAVTLVPEKREEVTTEGGLDITGQKKRCQSAIKKLKKQGIEVSLFIDPESAQIKASKEVGADFIELHTGTYANATGKTQEKELAKLIRGAKQAKKIGLGVNAGHGLTVLNLPPLAQAKIFHEFNIGHSLIARAVFVGLEKATREFKNILLRAK
jgi:pyridoxine 5-phosphate synthase